MKVHTNNNKNRRTSKQSEELIDLKKLSIQQLYDMAEQEYRKISSEQQNKWHSIISRGGTKKDKINLMTT